MSIAERLLKPEYCFRPSQLLRRILHARAPVPEHVIALQPWGLAIGANPREGVGRHLWDLGIIDLPVCEVIWRLLEPGENAADVGANIGAVTSLMAARTGTGGIVWSFEPHPTIHAEFLANVDRWRNSGKRIGRIIPSTKALSDQQGSAELFEPDDFAGNHGSASLEKPSDAQPNHTRKSYRIDTAPLDASLPVGTKIGVLKMDVEGHEINVLRGATRFLGAKLIRDVVYEDHHGYPSETSSALEQAGYRIFLIDRTFWRPQLLNPMGSTPSVSWLPPNYLATLNPTRAEELCRPSGWQCL
ncbi:MAG TPA: FkbM family methyltransferase [Candidatus Limnocylindria bacterium]|jgi:FkbM family methyltransferase|nr:FkbM family methyltransferase [Candidatus Limnocylindria bacterium]